MKKRISIHDSHVLDLCEKDPVMKKLIAVVGDINVSMRPDYFRSLVRSVIGQQISVAAASAIFNRLDALMNHAITAEKMLEETQDSLRNVGLSARKVLYLQDLSQKVASGDLHLDAFDQLDNNEILKALTSVKGIGKWTAEMFLIFSLGRMNVLSLDDIGLQRGAKWLYRVDKSYRRKILIDKSQLWAPHFTIASFYLWEVVHLDLEKRFDSIDDINGSFHNG